MQENSSICCLSTLTVKSPSRSAAEWSLWGGTRNFLVENQPPVHNHILNRAGQMVKNHVVDLPSFSSLRP